MPRLYRVDNGDTIGQITDDQLKFLVDQLEEEHDLDQDYYIDRDTLELLSDNGGDPELLAIFDAALAQHGARASQICAEITETALLHDTPAATRNLNGLVERGVSIAIDDFGTGYASLTYLRRYHVDVLKVDRSFVTDIVTSSRDQRLTAAVVAMARQLDIVVTAEGVETRAQADVVRTLGCTGAQGYLWSPAVPPAEFELIVKRHH